MFRGESASSGGRGACSAGEVSSEDCGYSRAEGRKRVWKRGADAREQRAGRPARWGCSSGEREQEEPSGRLWPRWRASATELGGDLLGGGEGPSDAHGPGTAGADRDIDAKDASEERHPREAMRGGRAQLRLEQGGDGRKLEGPVGDEEGELLGGLGLLGARNDAGAQGVMAREDTVVANSMGAGRWNEGAESSEEGVRSHLGVGGPEAGGLLEVDADLTVCSALDGVESKRWLEEIATQALDAAAVATVDGDGGMQLHAEGGDEQGRSRRGLAGRGRRCPQRQGELDAGGHGRIDLAVTVVRVELERRAVGVHALQRVDEVRIGEAFEGAEWSECSTHSPSCLNATFPDDKTVPRTISPGQSCFDGVFSHGGRPCRTPKPSPPSLSPLMPELSSLGGGSLTDAQRAECRTLWRETAAQRRSPVLVQLEVLEVDDDAERREDWKNHLEYFLEHDGIGFFADEPRLFHICRRHTAARAVVRSGILPPGFDCPLGRAGACPMRHVGASGRAVRFTPVVLGEGGCPDLVRGGPGPEA